MKFLQEQDVIIRSEEYEKWLHSDALRRVGDDLTSLVFWLFIQTTLKS